MLVGFTSGNSAQLLNVDDGLDETGAAGEVLKLCGHFVQAEAMGDPRCGIDLAIFDQADDAWELVATVSAGEDGDFFAM